jgi:hypothetical protein
LQGEFIGDMPHPVHNDGSAPPLQGLLVLLEVSGVHEVLFLFLAEEEEGVAFAGGVYALFEGVELF